MADEKKLGPDRTALLHRFEEATNVPVESSSKSEEAPAAAPAALDNALPQSKSVEAPVEPPVVGEKPAADAKADVKPVTEEMVTVKALHEEREKRKAKTLEARKLTEELQAKDKAIADERARNDALEARLRALETKPAAPGAKPAAPAQDEVTRQLAEENRKLKEASAKATQEAQRLAADKANAEVQTLIAGADKKLAAEGFPGFTRFTRDVYDAIVAKVQSGELEEKDVTPEVWEKTYREEVYPATRKVFEQQVKDEKAAKKLADKKAASLVSSPGSAPEAPEEADQDAPQTPESYRKFRKTIQ
jgi:hypothetical protein